MLFHRKGPFSEDPPNLNSEMHYFTYKRNDLYCENIKVKDLAKEFGTPFYLYSARTISEHFHKIKKAFSSIDPLICYSLKANSNLSILKLLVKEGAGMDIVSGGELYKVKKVNCPAKKIVYASVGKTEEEIEEAVRYGILMFNVESLSELRKLEEVAVRLKKKINVALRLNPEVEPRTHAYIITGKKGTKFGMDRHSVKAVFFQRQEYPHLNIVAIHIHIGSQITQAAPFARAIKKVKSLVDELEIKGICLKYFNIGGGLGIVYDKENPQTADGFARRVMPLLKEMSARIILEPGRFIVGNAGILVSKVIYLKDTPYKQFVIVDAGMNDLIRPSLYEAYHKIIPLVRRKKAENKRQKLVDVVGPVCESGDFLGKDRYLELKEGDYLAVLGCGAYGFSMSSNYNSRPRAAEVLVKNNRAYLVNKRETYKDLVDKEALI